MVLAAKYSLGSSAYNRHGYSPYVLWSVPREEKKRPCKVFVISPAWREWQRKCTCLKGRSALKSNLSHEPWDRDAKTSPPNFTHPPATRNEMDQQSI